MRRIEKIFPRPFLLLLGFLSVKCVLVLFCNLTESIFFLLLTGKKVIHFHFEEVPWLDDFFHNHRNFFFFKIVVNFFHLSYCWFFFLCTWSISHEKGLLLLFCTKQTTQQNFSSKKISLQLHKKIIALYSLNVHNSRCTPNHKFSAVCSSHFCPTAPKLLLT